MLPLRRTLLKAVERLKINLADPNLDIGLAPEQQAAFNKRVVALRSFGQGVSCKSIEAQTGLTRQQVRYFVVRLEVLHTDGTPLGLRALQGGAQKAREYTTDVLSLGRPVAGSLKALFLAHPSICQTLTDLVLYGKHPDLKEKLELNLVADDVVHALMKTLCAAAGIVAPRYPFCGDREGKPALSKWIKRTRARKAQEDLLANLMNRPPEDCLRRTIRRGYACVQADAHSIAVKWRLRVPSLRGEGYIDIVVTRLWIITLVECVRQGVRTMRSRNQRT